MHMLGTPHTTVYVSLYYYVTMYVASYYYICVLTRVLVLVEDCS
jgi:hypothetical protein